MPLFSGPRIKKCELISAELPRKFLHRREELDLVFVNQIQD
jgi:hypothetical protein